MPIQQIPLARLIPAKKPLRRHSKESLATLAASISAEGVLQNLVVTPNKGGKFEVIAGNGRLQALLALKKSRDKKITAKGFAVPCLVMATAHTATAALAENVAREDMHPVEKHEAFAAIVASGHKEEDVARRFGWSRQDLSRVVAIGKAHPTIRQACRDGKIDIGALRAFARLPDPARQIELWKDLGQYRRTNEEDVLRAVENRKIDPRVAAFDWKAAGIKVEADLFGGKAAIVDERQFWKLQRLAAEKIMAEHKAAGWGKVEIKEGVDEHFSGTNYPNVALDAKADEKKKAKGTATILLRKNGAMESVYWMKRPEPKANPARAKAFAQGKAYRKDDPGAGYPAAVDMALGDLKTFALQAAIGGNALAGLALIIHELLTQDGIGRTGIDECPGQLRGELRAIDDKLRVDLVTLLPGGDPQKGEELHEAASAALLTALASMTVEALAGILAGLQARRVEYGGMVAAAPDEVLDALAIQLKVAPRLYWSPDEAFLKGLGEDTLRQIAREAFGDEAEAALPAKGKKGAIAKTLAANFARASTLEDEASRRANRWLPPALRFKTPEPAQPPKEKGARAKKRVTNDAITVTVP